METLSSEEADIICGDKGKHKDKQLVKGNHSTDAIAQNLQNFAVFMTKSNVGIQKLDDFVDPFFQELNDFLLCERTLNVPGNTCYLQSVLICLNSVKRFTLNLMMRDPFPFDEDTMSGVMRTFMTNYRRMDEEPENYDDILEVLAKHKPE